MQDGTVVLEVDSTHTGKTGRTTLDRSFGVFVAAQFLAAASEATAAVGQPANVLDSARPTYAITRPTQVQVRSNDLLGHEQSVVLVLGFGSAALGISIDRDVLRAIADEMPVPPPADTDKSRN